MFKHLSAFILTTSAFGLALPVYAQTTLAELDAAQQVAPKAAIVDPPIDYALYDSFIETMTVKQGGRSRVAYNFIREQEQDVINPYITYLAQQDVSALSENDKVAYWLNVQNIVTVQAILEDGKKKKTLKKLRGTTDKPGTLWTKPRLNIAGQDMSLQDIETKLLTEFDNPNIIYGIYQGVRGAPSLTPTAYRGATVEEALANNAKQYVNSNGIVTVKNNVVEVTPVFLWYKGQAFGGDDKLLINHLKENAKPTLKSALYRGRTLEATALNYRPDNYDVAKANKARAKANKAQGRSQRVPSPQPQQPRGGGGYGS